VTNDDVFAALFSGDVMPWAALRMASEEFIQACSERDLTCLVAERLRGLGAEACDWPPDVFAAFARMAREQVARELLRQKELISVLDALGAEGIDPILLKGTALAYGLYDSPWLRPRLDTDLLIRQTDVGDVRRVMANTGYRAPNFCDGDLVFCQFPVKKTDQLGLTHTFDFHWKISTQSVFAELLTFDEIAALAMDLPALGRHARAAGFVHALLVACIHPVMHHRNVESPIWIYDVHLLASRLTTTEFECFTELAIRKKIAAICHHQLALAHRLFATRIPDALMTQLATVPACEPSAAYLEVDRRWNDDLVSNIRALPGWGDRLRLLREVVFPGRAYMMKAYDIPPSALGAALLPVLYLHRLASGSWKVIAGQK
jgi:hypothetical protein